MNRLLVMGYIAVFFFFALTLFTCLVRWNGLSRFLSVMALVFNALILAGIWIVSGQMPVYGIFGGLLLVTFVLGILGAFCCRIEEVRLSVKAWTWIGVLLLYCITLFFPKEPPPYQFNHSDLWVILFHGFRCLALSFALFSAAHFIRFRLEPQRKRVNHFLFKQGRNFLLLSALVFLCGEYSGIIWCQIGWGDFWHWGSTFFQSTLIILCLMFAFHIPGKNPGSDDLRSVIGIMVSLLMLSVTVFKGLSI